MRQLALEAKASAGNLKAFKQYNLNMRVDALNQAIPTADWDRCARKGDPAALRAETLKALARAHLFCSVGPRRHGRYERASSQLSTHEPRRKVAVRSVTFGFPATTSRRASSPTASRTTFGLVRDFLNVTPGKVVDKGFIADEILSLSKRYNLRELAYDPALAQGLIKMILEKGFKKDRVVKFAQTMLELRRAL
jgi:phage terminase large subunit-like protein